MTHLAPPPITDKETDAAYKQGLQRLTDTESPNVVNISELSHYDTGFWAAWEALGYKRPDDPALPKAESSTTPNEQLAEFKEALSDLPIALIGFQHWAAEAAKDMTLIPSLTRAARDLSRSIEAQNRQLRQDVKERQ